jgi:2-amino-4-hydroxy-6-hydroxymethyldihydropteridine diphosphokinase
MAMKNTETAQVIAYVALGSNLDEPAKQIKSARYEIASLTGVKEVAFSSLYQSLPMGPQDQPDYINAVMCVATDLLPMQLLHCLQTIENEHGRIRKGERWGARTLDLDILLYGDQKIDLPDLIIPHIGMTERSFVLYPLFEIAPELVVPGEGSITELVAKCPDCGLRKID